ncbi:MAG: AAA family ATPase [Lachnospiraceae bacterium]|nr:AAA family ATPase [Lachnospiraceae bacterium]
MYQVGMYGGSFNPLHMGHVECILKAASMCRELYIVLSIGGNRGEIDGRIRYRWLYRLTKHVGNVTILTIGDDAATKEEYTREYWQKDADDIKRRIGKKIDVVFCGSDYGTDSFWNVCYPESEMFIFRRNGISSTEIRKNPYAHWDQLPKVVRPYYTKKVLLMGGESTGKSTLTIHLAQLFNAEYIDEAGRELSEKSGTDTMMIPEDYTEILLRHKLNETEALERGSKVLFIDTDALITRFFMDFLDGDDPRIEANRVLADAIDALNRYDLILFLEPDVEFFLEGGRSEEIRDNRIKYSERIKELLRTHGREFTCISGEYSERLEKAASEVKKLIGEE